LFSLIGLAGRAHRYAELSSHFRLQYLIIASVCLIALAVFRSWRWVMASAFCLLLNAALVVPWYLSPTGTAQPQAYNFRVLLANVLYSNRNYRALLELVKTENPDLIVLQEATPKWVAATQELKTAYLYFLLGDDATIGGVACYSRCEMEEARLSPELRHSVAGPVIRLNFRGRAVSIIAIHPPPPVTRDEFAVRNVMLVAAAEAARQLPPPTVLIGDLNSTMWSPYFSRLLRDSGLKNARQGFGVLPTWPMFLPPMIIPIDHCLVSDEVFVVNCRTGSRIGSDHLPLIVDLALPNDN
jgi:endonuclease/exonuclease/phosphatase (EEP) superfamily protein YafD